MFTNQPAKVYSLIPMAENAFRAGDYSTAARFASTAIAASVLVGAMKTALYTGDEEKKKASLASRVLVNTVKDVAGLYPIGGREFANTVIGPAMGLPANSSDTSLLADSLVRTAQGATNVAGDLFNWSQGELDPEKATKHMLDIGYTLGPLLGLPTPAAIDVGKRIQAGTPLPGLSPPEEADAAPRPITFGHHHSHHAGL